MLYTNVDGQCDKLVTETVTSFLNCRPPKLTALEMISCSRDMVGAHQSLNGSRNLTMPLLVCYHQPTYHI